ncbi:F0F1 ATP synthase subunit A [Patescibacteria group bacterium]|nr:F0F1 ATP synthase subunit A [Patescibacteria group bacterium]
MPEISIKAEEIFQLFGIKFTNTLLLSTVVFLVFLLIAFFYNRASSNPKKGVYFYFVNFILKGIYQLFESVLKEQTEYFFPILGSFFLFIIFQNWFGLLPGVGSLLYHHVPLLRGNEADLNSTLSLAVISVFLIQVFGIKYLGFKGYLSKFINFKDPISFFTGILEIVSEISKVISFSFRLFGNIFAGEVLLTIMAFLVPILASFPFLLLELFVGFIQALVFAMLTAVFVNVAITKHH